MERFFVNLLLWQFDTKCAMINCAKKMRFFTEFHFDAKIHEAEKAAKVRSTFD